MSFFTLLPKENPKNQNIEKMKKIAGDIIITYVYQKSQSYDLRFLDTDWDRQNFLSFWAISCHFTTLLMLKIKSLEKWEKIPDNITTLYMCTISKNNMIYGSWYMECDRQNLFIILDYFLPFYHSNDLENQNLKKKKKMKNYLDISTFYKSVLDMMIICYTVPEIWCVIDVVFIFHFGLFFALLPP